MFVCKGSNLLTLLRTSCSLSLLALSLSVHSHCQATGGDQSNGSSLQPMRPYADLCLNVCLPRV